MARTSAAPGSGAETGSVRATAALDATAEPAPEDPADARYEFLLTRCLSIAGGTTTLSQLNLDVVRASPLFVPASSPDALPDDPPLLVERVDTAAS